MRDPLENFPRVFEQKIERTGRSDLMPSLIPKFFAPALLDGKRMVGCRSGQRDLASVCEIERVYGMQ